MTQDSLKPCPFCGGESVTDFIDDLSHIIECNDCACRTSCGDTPEEAIAAWNRRAAPASGAEKDAEPWRLLQKGELMKTDDEALSDDCTTWTPLNSCIFVGMEYLPGVFLPVRRKDGVAAIAAHTK